VLRNLKRLPSTLLQVSPRPPAACRQPVTHSLPQTALHVSLFFTSRCVPAKGLVRGPCCLRRQHPPPTAAWQQQPAQGGGARLWLAALGCSEDLCLMAASRCVWFMPRFRTLAPHSWALAWPRAQLHPTLLYVAGTGAFAGQAVLRRTKGRILWVAPCCPRRLRSRGGRH